MFFHELIHNDYSPCRHIFKIAFSENEAENYYLLKKIHDKPFSKS